MICNTKTEFLTSLRVALEQNHIDTRDILTDFRQHFEDGAAAGESEAEVCRKLGDIDEIIKQYISDNADETKAASSGEMPDTSGFGDNSYAGAEPPYSQPRYAEPAAFSPSAGKIVGVICLDLFVYSWALPSLASVIIGLISAALSVSITGIVILISAILGCFMDISGFITTGFAPISLVFLGTLLSALGGMLVIASIASVKGFINICIAVVNQHAKIFVGHKVAQRIGKRKENAQ